jgi:hypothetical protein
MFLPDNLRFILHAKACRGTPLRLDHHLGVSTFQNAEVGSVEVFSKLGLYLKSKGNFDEDISCSDCSH